MGYSIYDAGVINRKIRIININKNIQKMGINDMVYRTKTYIAGDWTGDSDLITKLEEWNKKDNLALSFVNVH